ncbi:MAG: hypothetical protein HOP26_07260 [Methylotenera sp.]|nr:hypothetical protein [Methylotenera sp.]
MRVFLLLLLTYANLSQALGIGDVALKSYLGEPLIAKINVTDVEKSPDVGCFSVTDASDIPAFRKANVTLKQNGNGYQLNITTPSVITEPIVNLRVLFECEPNFKREYVLLLDPASLTANSDRGVADQPVASNASIGNGYSHPLNPHAHLGDAVNLETNIAPLNQPAKEKKVKNKSSKKTKFKQDATGSGVIDEKLALSYTGPQLMDSEKVASPVADNKVSVAKSKIAPSANTSKPYLTISGGNLSPNESVSHPKLSLRLETQIDFNRVEASAPLTNSDTMDEITVMANRLAHLEKQVINLQTKNAQLLDEAALAKHAGLESSAQQSQWLRNILIAIGILVALAVAELLRRKSVRDRLAKEQAIWFDAEEDADDVGENSASTPNTSDYTKDLAFDNDTFDPLPHHHLSSHNHSGAFSINDDASDSGDNILENADVFIEHGRPALAIQLLQNHLSDFPTESPKIWLKLFSLIVTNGTEAEYDHAVAECKHFFNIKMPSFAEAAMPDESSIEEFPHIVSRLEGVWGSQFAVGFLSDLIYNQYAQPRDGFECGTFEELFFLKQIAEILSENTSKEQASFVKPASDNTAFNEATFVNATLLNATLVSDEVTPQGQMPPSYEVDMLVDFDEAPEIQTDGISDAPNLNTNLEDQSAPKTDLSSQSDSLDFTTPTDNLFETTLQLEIDSVTESLTLDEASDENKQKEANVIEWDLPKLN